MPVPSAITDLSQTAGSNSPGSGESPVTADDYLRTYASFTAQHRDGQGFTAEVDLASAATCSIGAQTSFFVRITGTTTITSFGVVTALPGPRFLRFEDALTLTHNSSTLVLPGGRDITTAAGDTCIATPISGGWVVSKFQPGGASNALVSGTTVATTSGTAKDWTGIPSWVKRITFGISGLSTNGSSIPMIQLGDAGGFEATGYTGSSSQAATAPSVNASSYSTGFLLNGSNALGVTYHGIATLVLLDSATNTWAFSVVMGRGDAATSVWGGGTKALSATLTQVRLTTVNGTDAFDAGSVNILYE
jgi:hypothetical protein